MLRMSLVASDVRKWTVPKGQPKDTAIKANLADARLAIGRGSSQKCQEQKYRPQSYHRTVMITVVVALSPKSEIYS